MDGCSRTDAAGVEGKGGHVAGESEMGESGQSYGVGGVQFQIVGDHTWTPKQLLRACVCVRMCENMWLCCHGSFCLKTLW